MTRKSSKESAKGVAEVQWLRNKHLLVDCELAMADSLSKVGDTPRWIYTTCFTHYVYESRPSNQTRTLDYETVFLVLVNLPVEKYRGFSMCELWLVAWIRVSAAYSTREIIQENVNFLRMFVCISSLYLLLFVQVEKSPSSIRLHINMFICACEANWVS